MADIHQEGDRAMTREEIHQHFYNEGYNAGSVKGYEQAIDDAVEWPERALPLRPDDRDEFIEQFKEAMKGE